MMKQLKAIVFSINLLLVIFLSSAVYGLDVEMALVPPLVEQGESMKLVWESNQATSCTGKQGISGEIALSGEYAIASVDKNTFYEIECSDGTSSKSLIIEAKIIPTFPQGSTLQVGENKEFTTLSSALSSANDNDIIEIDSGTYTCDIKVFNQDNLTIRGVGDSKPILDATGCSISNGKAILVPQGENIIFDNIHFKGAKVNDRNGAGIRLESTGVSIIKNSLFENNEMGILSSNVGVSGNERKYLIIDSSEFKDSGAIKTNGAVGLTHNIYMTSAFVFILKNSYSHNVKHHGHLLKSRAIENYILYNRLTDESAVSSYNINIPQGGLTYIIGNVIEQGPNSANSGIIDYSSEANSADNDIQKLYISGNTIVDNKKTSGVKAIKLYNYKDISEVKIINNLFVNLDESKLIEYKSGDASAVTRIENNLYITDEELTNPSSYQYFLKGSSSAINAGINPGKGFGYSLFPLYEYVYDLSSKQRSIYSQLDVGAFEFNEDDEAIFPVITFDVNQSSIQPGGAVMLSWESQYAQSCSASGNWDGEKEISGSQEISPIYITSTYTLTCFGEDDTQTSHLVSVLVEEIDSSDLTIEILSPQDGNEVSRTFLLEYEIDGTDPYDEIKVFLNNEEISTTEITQSSGTIEINLNEEGLQTIYLVLFNEDEVVATSQNIRVIYGDEGEDSNPQRPDEGILTDEEIDERYTTSSQDSQKSPNANNYINSDPNCKSNLIYGEWTQCSNNYQLREVEDKNSCISPYIEKVECGYQKTNTNSSDISSDKESVNLNLTQLDNIDEFTTNYDLSRYNGKYLSINTSLTNEEIYVTHSDTQQEYLLEKEESLGEDVYKVTQLSSSSENKSDEEIISEESSSISHTNLLLIISIVGIVVLIAYNKLRKK